MGRSGPIAPASSSPSVPASRTWLELAFLSAFAHASVAAQEPPAGRRSSYRDMLPQTRAMQDDDTANPGMLWVLDGGALCNAPAGTHRRSCAGCHGDAAQSMKGVAPRYPSVDDKHAKVVDLEERINLCRAEHQGAPRFTHEGKELVALTAYVARQSHGIAIALTGPRLAPTVAKARTLYQRRQGQLDLSCAQCHDDNPGRKLAGITIPEAHPTGYPGTQHGESMTKIWSSS